ncbi:unnamed protein product [Mucor hiemalis]
MNKNIQFCQIVLIGLLINFVNTQQQPTKLQTSTLRYAASCKEKVNTDSTIQLRYTAKLLETNEIIENKTMDLIPGELTIVKGFEQGIQGMCEGEIRRLTIPASLHISNDGQVSDKAMVYDVEVLRIQSPQIITPLFWMILSCISAAYFVFNRLAERKSLAEQQKIKIK